MGQVGHFIPDRTKPAGEERQRLYEMFKGAKRAGYENVAEHLLEQDSELFSVSADDGVYWRDDDSHLKDDYR